MNENAPLKDYRYQDLKRGQKYCVRVNKDDRYKYVSVLSTAVLDKGITEGWFGEDFYVGLAVSELNAQENIMTKYYRITIAGEGGEAVAGKLSPEEYDYWQTQAALRREEFGLDEDDNPFEVYILSTDDERWDAVPEEFRREYWNECDDLLHLYGAALSSEIIIEEVDSDDPYDADVIENLIDDADLEVFIEENELSVSHTDFFDWAPANTHMVAGFSQEKGVLFTGVVALGGTEFDLNKLSFKTTELIDGQTLATEVWYDGDCVDNYGGDTRGVALYIELYDA